MSIFAALASPTGAQDFLFDFQGDTEPDIGIDTPGATIITPSTPLYNAGQGYGFLSPGVDEARIRGGVDSLLQDFVAINTDLPGAAELRFRVDLTPGLYRIQSWNGDTDNPRASRMILSFDGGTTEHLFYGSDTNVPNAPLPGTFMTTFAEDPPGTPNSGLPMVYDQNIPAGKSHSGLNYNMEFGEILQVDDVIQIDGGSLTFMVGSFDRLLNAIRIDLDPVLPEPPTDFLFDFQGAGSTAAAHAGTAGPGPTVVDETTPLYSAEQGYGLLYPANVARSRGGTDLLLRDFLAVETNPASPFAFRVDLPSGTYRVRSWQGDMDAARNPIRMILSFTDAGAGYGGVFSEDRLYGAFSHNPTVVRAGTFLTTFVDSGTPGVFGQTVPGDQGGSGLNLSLDPREFLEVDDTFEINGGHVIFLVESGDFNRLVNAIKIVKAFVPDCGHVINTGGRLAGDLNRDCKVNLTDLLQFFSEWLDCTNPDDPGCE
jgi:hypothetical protein